MIAQKYYEERLSVLKISHLKVKKEYQILTFLRLVLFVGVIVVFYAFWGQLILLPAFFITMIAFLFTVNLSVNKKIEKDRFQALININENELKVLDGDWSKMEDGVEFKNPKHPYSNDMDLFGNKSIFQLLNRTVSSHGKIYLASALLDGTENPSLNSRCIEALTDNIAWSQEFMAEGMLRKSEQNKILSLSLLSGIKLEINILTQILRFLLPIVGLTSTFLYSFNLIGGGTFIVIITVVLSIISQQLKKTNSIAQQLTDQSGRVKTILKQLHLYDKLVTKDEVLKAQKEVLLNHESSVLMEVKSLDVIMKRFDFRINILVGVVLNFFLAWDLQLQVQSKKWIDKNREYLAKWEEQIAEIEFWISGAIYRFNFPNTVYASITENDAYEIKDLGHPFVNQSKRVTNDVSIIDQEQFVVLTGPNMAGKSTYLRSLGLAIICSNSGLPILATSCKLPKVKLFTSMRTSDDLTVESSYFHAELIRLRFIVDAIENGEKVFIILDEILKGTNSKDKEIGSALFLQKLKRLKTKGIIATHDLSLCVLADNDKAFKNMYFDSIIEKDKLSFDYKINNGVCQNMNASFLLKQMKLVD